MFLQLATILYLFNKKHKGKNVHFSNNFFKIILDIYLYEIYMNTI